MTYRIVRLIGGSWAVASKKTFKTFKDAVDYRYKLSGSQNLAIIESKRLKRALKERASKKGKR